MVGFAQAPITPVSSSLRGHPQKHLTRRCLWNCFVCSTSQRDQQPMRSPQKHLTRRQGVLQKPLSTVREHTQNDRKHSNTTAETTRTSQQGRIATHTGSLQRISEGRKKEKTTIGKFAFAPTVATFLQVRLLVSLMEGPMEGGMNGLAAALFLQLSSSNKIVGLARDAFCTHRSIVS